MEETKGVLPLHKYPLCMNGEIVSKADWDSLKRTLKNLFIGAVLITIAFVSIFLIGPLVWG
jgi:hypothetical protein